MTHGQRDLRLGIWFSVLSLERTISAITGRPSMVRDIDCSAVLPEDGTIDADKHLQDSTLSERIQSSRPAKDTKYGELRGQMSSHATTSPVSVESTFFHHVELSSLANLALSRLYSPSVRHIKWSELQSSIRELNQKLHEWNSNLRRPYETDLAHQKPERDLGRAAVGMLFHSTRIIINRPCHCRLDQRIANQSSASYKLNVDSASQCVASALAMLALIPDQPDPVSIYQGPLWWMFFHHLKRATIVLLQEITFLCENAPPNSENVLTVAKKAINWLHAMGLSNHPAYSSWVTLSRLLHRAGQRFGGDLSGVRIAEEEGKENLSSFATRRFAAQGDQIYSFAGPMFEIDGQDSQLGLGDMGLDHDFLGDLNFDTWDQTLMEQGEEVLAPAGGRGKGRRISSCRI
ncbi:MAG: hypothetical protein Q9170_001996 [Blastenia crenularia]